jgi:hypothetical protein
MISYLDYIDDLKSKPIDFVIKTIKNRKSLNEKKAAAVLVLKDNIINKKEDIRNICLEILEVNYWNSYYSMFDRNIKSQAVVNRELIWDTAIEIIGMIGNINDIEILRKLSLTDNSKNGKAIAEKWLNVVNGSVG